MDKRRQPGISLQSICMLDCSVKTLNRDGSFDAAGGVLTLVDADRTEAEDDTQMILTARFDVMHGALKKSCPCKFTATFEAIYERTEDSPMGWDEFKTHIAVAHIVPFLREFVHNMTGRMPSGGCLIPPVNAFRLVNDYHVQLAKKKKKDLAAEG